MNINSLRKLAFLAILLCSYSIEFFAEQPNPPAPNQKYTIKQLEAYHKATGTGAMLEQIKEALKEGIKFSIGSPSKNTLLSGLGFVAALTGIKLSYDCIKNALQGYQDKNARQIKRGIAEFMAGFALLGSGSYSIWYLRNFTGNLNPVE